MPDEYMDSGGMDEESTKTPEAEETEGTTALIPKALLAGKDFKPGDEVVFKIVHEYEDEVEIEYAPEKPSTPEEKPDMTADEEFDAMAGKGY